MNGPEQRIEEIAAIIAPFAGAVGGLVTALRAVQAKIGFLPVETEEAAAGIFNLSRAEVKGVISFYSDFARTPKGRTVIRLCAAEACQALGGRELERAVERRFALKAGGTSASGDLTIEHVYCLGLCSAGPAAIFGGRLMAKASEEKIVAAFDQKQREKA